MGAWYATLTRGRQEATRQITQKVAELTDEESAPLKKIQTLAEYVQTGVRYVAIELGAATTCRMPRRRSSPTNTETAKTRRPCLRQC